MANELVRASDINVDELKQIGALLAESGYFNSDNARASVAQLVVKVLAGRELGYGPWASASGIHIIQGKMTVSANLMADAVKRSGRYDYRIREMSDKRVAIEFFALEGGKRESLGTSEFTLEDGRKAGTKNLDKFPRNMLFARAMSNGVKWFCPDVFSGNAVYVPEEMGANVDGDGNVIDVPRSVNSVTGEVTYGTPAPRNGNGHANGNGNGNGNAQQPPADEWSGWKSRSDAYAWAVEVGACANEFEARNSMEKIVASQFGGKVKDAQTARNVYAAFVARQKAKLQEQAQRAQDEAEITAGASELDSVTLDNVPELAH